MKKRRMLAAFLAAAITITSPSVSFFQAETYGSEEIAGTLAERKEKENTGHEGNDGGMQQTADTGTEKGMQQAADTAAKKSMQQTSENAHDESVDFTAGGADLTAGGGKEENTQQTIDNITNGKADPSGNETKEAEEHKEADGIETDSAQPSAGESEHDSTKLPGNQTENSGMSQVMDGVEADKQQISGTENAVNSEQKAGDETTGLSSNPGPVSQETLQENTDTSLKEGEQGGDTTQETEWTEETCTETEEMAALELSFLNEGGKVTFWDAQGNCLEEMDGTKERYRLDIKAGETFCIEAEAEQGYEIKQFRISDAEDLWTEELIPEEGAVRLIRELMIPYGTWKAEITWEEIIGETETATEGQPLESIDETETMTEGQTLESEVFLEEESEKIALFAATEEDEDEPPKVDHAILQVGRIPANGAKYPQTLVNGGIALYTANKTITLYDKDGNELGSKIAYCMQPPKATPPTGNVIPEERIEELETGTTERTLAKILYYLYGGPAWNKEVTDKNGDSINFKELLDEAGCTDKDHYVAMTHLALGYVYDYKEWNYGIDSGGIPVGSALNSKGVKAIEDIIGRIKKMPDPRAEFSSSSVSSFYEDGKLVSQSVTYYANEDNTAKVKLSADIYLVNETTGKRESGTVTISGGDRFHLESNGISGNKSYTFTTAFATDFSAYKITFPGAAQDVGFSYTSGNKKIVLGVEWKEQKVLVNVRKVSASNAVTDGNSLYSLKGAEFTLYNGEKAVAVFKTDENGNTPAVEVEPGTYTLKETVVPKGYKKSADQTVQIVGGEATKTILISDEPVTGNIKILVKKTAKEGNTGISLRGARFKAEFFGAENAIEKPLRTWVFETKENEIIEFSESYKLSGDSLYSGGTIPLGTLVVTEIKAPEGFLLDSNPQTVHISQSKETAVFDNAKKDAVFYFEDSMMYGGIRIKKEDSENGTAQGNASLEGAEFAVINANDFSVMRADEPGKLYQKGQEVYRLVTDENGMAQTPQVTVDGVSSQLLQNGTYTVKELKPPKGYRLEKYEYTVTLTENGKVEDISATPAKDPVIRGGFLLEKWDLELQKAQPQGDAILEGAEFTLINRSSKEVLVDTDQDGTLESYAPGEKIAVFYTDSSGQIRTPADYLPYGSYRLEETAPPRGYTREGEGLIREFSILTDGQYVEFNTEALAAKNRVIRFDLTILKFRDSMKDEEVLDDLVPMEGIVFGIYRKSTGEKVMEITTDQSGMATTRQEGASFGALPYGTYLVREEKHPADVFPVKEFEVQGTEDGKEYKGIYKNDRPVAEYLELRKIDAETGKSIPTGAVFQILDEKKEVVEFRVNHPKHQVLTSFTTDENGVVALPERLKYGVYYLHEVTAPEGYLLSEDVKFTVSSRNDWENIITVTCADVPVKGRICLEKTDADTGKHLQGAVFLIKAAEDIVTGDGTVRLKKGEMADTVTIGADGTGSSAELYLGKYQVRELQAPAGYCLDAQVYEAELSCGKGEQEAKTVTLKCENHPTKLQLQKKDTDGKLLEGVTFAITQEHTQKTGFNQMPGTAIGTTYTTDTQGRIDISYLLPGIYAVTELETLPGYIKDTTPFYFTVDEKGRIFESDARGISLHTENAGADCLVIQRTNGYTCWDFSKQEVNGSGELPGAEMKILDEKGEELYSWVSGDKPHRISKLPVGNYTLEEKVAPDGYVVASSMPFTVTETAVIQHLTMTDKQVLVSKQDITNGEELEGAKLTVIDSQGNVVDTWTSRKDVRHPVSGLQVNETYTLREETAPQGYLVAEEIQFTVEDDFKIQTVVMKDRPAPIPQDVPRDTPHKIPKTGDLTPFSEYLLLAFASVLAVCGLLVYKRRLRRRNAEQIQ